MATENPKPAKVAIVDEVKQNLEGADAVVATEYRGLDVPQQAELRAAVKSAGGEIKIYKNTLARLAATDLGLEIDELLTGPTALAFTKPGTDDAPADPVALTKALQDFADANEAFVIKGGLMDGAPLAPADVAALAKVPPRDVMLAKFAGLLQAPMANLASLMQAAPQKLAGLIKALVEEQGGEVKSADDADDADDDAAASGADDSEAASDSEAADDADADEAQDSAAPAADDGGDDAGDASADAADAADDSSDADAGAEETPAEEASTEEASTEEEEA